MRRLAGLLAALSFQAGAVTLTTEDYPPFNFSEDGGQSVTGQSTEILKEMSRRTDIPVSIRLLPWRRAYLMAQDDPDTCVYSTTRTEEREKRFKWVGPLVKSSWAFYTLSDNPIALSSFNDAKKYRIGGYRGDAKAIFLKENGFPIDEANNDEQTARKLMAGRIDLWAGDTGTAQWIARRVGIKVRPLLTFKDVELYAACHLAMPDAQIRRMNEAIKAIRDDGTYERIEKKYR